MQHLVNMAIGGTLCGIDGPGILPDDIQSVSDVCQDCILNKLDRMAVGPFLKDEFMTRYYGKGWRANHPPQTGQKG